MACLCCGCAAAMPQPSLWFMSMKSEDRYDSLIQYYVEKHSKFDWTLVKSVIKQESSFSPDALSECGASGLMQMMPDTAIEWNLHEPHNPESNINAGVAYLWYLYSKFAEIPDEQERLKFALAAYNAGRGNINEMLEYARDSEGLPVSYKLWKVAGSKKGKWQTWDYSKQFLSYVTGKSSKQTIDYVANIEKHFIKYKAKLNTPTKNA